ncbi:MAG: hypothetical protein QM500_07090 [Methylococcales bacterium]
MWMALASVAASALKPKQKGGGRPAPTTLNAQGSTGNNAIGGSGAVTVGGLTIISGESSNTNASLSELHPRIYSDSEVITGQSILTNSNTINYALIAVVLFSSVLIIKKIKN